jgi:hypothetical protein
LSFQLLLRNDRIVRFLQLRAWSLGFVSRQALTAIIHGEFGSKPGKVLMGRDWSMLPILRSV